MNALGGRRGAAVGAQSIRAARNAFAARVLDRQAVLPFMAVYHVNYACNAACSFCSRAFDLNVHSTSGNAASLARKREILEGIREFAPSIYFTGGEPLLDSEIEEALEYARGIGFFPITLNTNASVLHHRQGVLRVADNVVISLHAVDERRLAKILRVTPAVARRALRNTAERIEYVVGPRTIEFPFWSVIIRSLEYRPDFRWVYVGDTLVSHPGRNYIKQAARNPPKLSRLIYFRAGLLVGMILGFFLVVLREASIRVVSGTVMEEAWPKFFLGGVGLTVLIAVGWSLFVRASATKKAERLATEAQP